MRGVRHWIAVNLRKLAYWFEPQQRSGDLIITLTADTTEFTAAIEDATKRLQKLAAISEECAHFGVVVTPQEAEQTLR